MGTIYGSEAMTNTEELTNEIMNIVRKLYPVNKYGNIRKFDAEIFTSINNVISEYMKTHPKEGWK